MVDPNLRNALLCLLPIVLFFLLAPFYSDGCANSLVCDQPFLGEATGRYRICEDKPDSWTVEFEQTGLFGNRWRYLHRTYWYSDGVYVAAWLTKDNAIAAAREHHRELLSGEIIERFDSHCDTTLQLE